MKTEKTKFCYLCNIQAKFRLFIVINVTILLSFSIDVRVLDRFSRNEKYPFKNQEVLVI